MKKSNLASEKKNNKVTRRLIQSVAHNRIIAIGALICALLSSILSLYGMRLTGRGIDLMIGQGQVDFSGLKHIVLIMSICFISSAILFWCMSALSNTLAFKTASRLRAQAFDRLMHMPLQYFDTHPHGDVISRLSNDIDAVSDGLLQMVSKFFSGIVLLMGSLVFMLRISPLVALLVLLVTPISLWLANLLRKRSANSFFRQSALNGEINGYTEEIMDAENLVMLYGQQETVKERFNDIDAELYTHGFRAQYYAALSNPMARLVNHIVYVIVGAVGGLLAMNKSITIGDLSSLLMYATQFAKPINEITSVATQIQAAFASATRIFSLLDEPIEEPDSPEAIEVKHAKGDIRFNDVAFSYDPTKELIRHLSLFASSGQTVAIVGPTGAGKTTLVNLLMRFYEVTDGTILLDEQDTQFITRDSLRRQFGMVLQDSWLFHGTVRENITYGHPNASDKEVIAASKATYADNFIRRLPHGYDTVIDMNSGLSQGQMQLLTLARAMLTDPPMLILDEATSSIDTRTEQHIQKALLKMMNGRTSFVIAHRLSTIRNADLILVLKDGKIIEQGTHQELIAKKSFYRQLHDSQFSS